MNDSTVQRQANLNNVNDNLSLLSEMAHIKSPFLLFHGLHDEKKSFSIKIEGMTVPPHFLQNDGRDVTQMTFSKK